LESVRLGLSYLRTEYCQRCLVREQCDVEIQTQCIQRH